MRAADPGGYRPGEQTPSPPHLRHEVSLLTVAREWGRLGCIGFGGPPAHIALLRALCVDKRGWMSAREFEDGVAAANLLPGPASTQLAIFCAWRLRGPRGALVGGACFIVPGLIVILALSAVFLAAHPPLWIRGAAAGANAAVPVVQTVAVVGYAAAGVGGGLLASAVAFTPSFVFVLAGGPRFDQLRRNASIQAFLTGAGPAAIGAIAGATIPLGLALSQLWQLGVLAVAAAWLVALRRGVVAAIVGAGALGVIAALAGAPLG